MNLVKTKSRILKFIENEGIKISDFLRRTEIKRGFLDKDKLDAAVSDLHLTKIIASFPQLSVDWLITGKGEMYSKTTQPQEVTNYLLHSDHGKEERLIPLYNIHATAGLVGLFQSPNQAEIVDTIKIPNLPKCDGAVFVTGDSMYPLLKSGDIVAYKQIHDFESEVFWGEMYLIAIEMASEEYVSVKFVQRSDKGDDYIKLVSQNQYHQPKDVHLSRVRAMALIKASVRLNSMG
ncbi:hypothetical protein FUAX_54770 (plasmid) [Fulvitalea axinellae]|uniref:Peptidase S24/S26A/S26B/S26C domain-containing protein n=1 Tax=Fulvitalea axinellae TaxID=1182444 RepID=A0AAU9DP92_9BACT|nr:hypothetical protein FUAX_54770 [Fulvitalea axinellae]